MPLFMEKPMTIEAFYFEGGMQSAREFIVWAIERGYTASWIPPIDYTSNKEDRSIAEVLLVTRTGYVKGHNEGLIELWPLRWFVLDRSDSGSPLIMADNSFKSRYQPVEEG